jgi:hypothetical protein
MGHLPRCTNPSCLFPGVVDLVTDPHTLRTCMWVALNYRRGHIRSSCTTHAFVHYPVCRTVAFRSLQNFRVSPKDWAMDPRFRDSLVAK